MKKLIIALLIGFPAVSFAQLADSSKRLLPVQGGLNFRDIGGYKTTDGREVVWGKIYRSAAISKLTDADVKLMDSRHIRTVVDFRGNAEAAAAPDRLVEGTDYVLSPWGSDSLPDSKKMVEYLKKGDFLTGFYGEQGVKYFGDRYRPLFVKLLTVDGDEAVMYHCTGGRDRTGMATALILYVLGVPEEKIEEDFVASNVYLKPMMGQNTVALAAASGMSEAEIRKAMELRPELLDIFFGSIKTHYGSVENFFSKEMGIGPNEIAILKSKYTKKI